MQTLNIYLLLKAVHLLALISWMVGIFYLPRLFVYHSKLKSKSESDEIFQVMERRLLKIIMNPAMIVTFITGISLIHFVGFAGGWLHIKILLVLFMAGFHGFLSKTCRDFVAGNNQKSERFFRIINEVPTILLILIVFLVIFKPL